MIFIQPPNFSFSSVFQDYSERTSCREKQNRVITKTFRKILKISFQVLESHNHFLELRVINGNFEKKIKKAVSMVNLKVFLPYFLDFLENFRSYIDLVEYFNLSRKRNFLFFKFADRQNTAS